MAEGRDWTSTQFDRCPDCGWDPLDVSDGDLARAVVDACDEWSRLLSSAPADQLRRRPEPAVWCALEYACHVRDLTEVFRLRIERMRVESDADLGWWDHEASVLDDDYAGQDPEAVGRDIVANGRALAATLDDVRSKEWDRTAERRPGEVFTIRGAARFVIHEIVHHRGDADRVIAGVET